MSAAYLCHFHTRFNFNISNAVIVGFLALLGIAAKTAIVMVREAVIDGAAMRLRPKLMTVFRDFGRFGAFSTSAALPVKRCSASPYR